MHSSADPAASAAKREAGAWMEVDLGVLGDNYREVRRRVGAEPTIIAAVKANAYGHGVVAVAQALVAEGVEILATGSMGDALAMRGAGIETPILLFGSHLPQDTEAVLQAGLIPTLCSLDAARSVSEMAAAPTEVYVKVDSGLGRLGVPVADAQAFITSVARLPNLVLAGVYTHLPFKEEVGRSWAERSQGAFTDLIDALAGAGIHIPVVQARSSAAILGGVDDGPCTAISPGHALYGLAPAAASVADTTGLQPVLRAIKTQLIQVTQHAASRTVGRAGAIELPAGALTGVVSFGMIHGYRDGQSAPPEMLVGGRRVPVLGVSLEYVTLDLTTVPDAAAGDEVVVLGRDGDATITLAEIAAWQGVTSLDVLLAFSGRLYYDYQRPARDGSLDDAGLRDRPPADEHEGAARR